MAKNSINCEYKKKRAKLTKTCFVIHFQISKIENAEMQSTVKKIFYIGEGIMLYLWFIVL